MRLYIRLRSLLFSVCFIAVSLLASCTVKNESLLLSHYQKCSDEDCPPVQQSIEGSLAIYSDLSDYTVNVDQSDLVEISGSCKDLGNKKNRILVEAYEGEDTGSVAPYVMNAASFRCNSSTTATINNQRCFFINQGSGIIDGDAEYPQCFNGRFSFSVRLGKILRENPLGAADENNPLKNYLVRFKLVVDDGAIMESAWSQAVVARSVSRPEFSVQTNILDRRCEIKVHPFRNVDRSHIRYSAISSREYAKGVTDSIQDLVSDRDVTLPFFFANLPLAYPYPTNGTGITDFHMKDLYPGIKYKIKLIAEDRIHMTSPLVSMYTLAVSHTPLNNIAAANYCNSPGTCTENSGFTESLECYIPPRLTVVSGQSQCSDYGTAPAPNVQVKAEPYVDNRVTPLLDASNIEWVVLKGSGAAAFTDDLDTSSFSACNSAPLVDKCKLTPTLNFVSADHPARGHFRLNPQAFTSSGCSGSYTIAYRFYKSPTEKGKWSDPITINFTP